MSGWIEFVAAFAVFFASHAIPPRTGVRSYLTARLGAGMYLAIYIALSLVLLYWLIVAAGRAPYVELWAPAPWTRLMPNLLMPVACLLFAFGAAAANPLSFGGRRTERFDPERPGMAALTRHPILAGFALWAVGHLVANGDLAHVILFGLFLLMAIGGMFALDKRKKRVFGEDEWVRLAANTSLASVGPGSLGRFARSLGPGDLIRLVAAIALYVVLLGLHPSVIGVSPLPSP